MDSASSSGSMGRFGSKYFGALQSEQELRSGLDDLCHSEESSGNEACLNEEEDNPTVDWKLPPVSPSDVYRGLTPLNFRALSQIKIKEKSVKTELSLNISFMEPPDSHSSQTWESEKEVRAQYFNNYLIERFQYQRYTYPQIDYYTM